jgi:hypothetical protein
MFIVNWELSYAFRTPIKPLPNAHQTSPERLTNLSRTPNKPLPNAYQTSTECPTNHSRTPNKPLPNAQRTIPERLKCPKRPQISEIRLHRLSKLLTLNF